MTQSGHPPVIAKYIVTNLLRIYYRQNTRIADYNAMATHLFNWRMALSWNQVIMKKFILNNDIQVCCIHHQFPLTTLAASPLLTNEKSYLHPLGISPV